MTTPSVSVILPAYNHAKYIGQTLASILRQTFRDFELLILDDGSSDYTFDVCRMFAARDSRIILRRQSNKGICATLNALGQQAQGKLLAFAASDDLFLPRKLEKQIAALEEDRQRVAVFSFVQEINEHNGPTSQPTGLFNHPVAEPLLPLRLLLGNFLCATSAMVRREALLEGTDSLAGTSERLHDFDMWLRASAQGSLYQMEQILSFYRIHDSNSSMGNASGCIMAEMADIIERRREAIVQKWPVCATNSVQIDENLSLLRFRSQAWEKALACFYTISAKKPLDQKQAMHMLHCLMCCRRYEPARVLLAQLESSRKNLSEENARVCAEASRVLTFAAGNTTHGQTKSATP